MLKNINTHSYYSLLHSNLSIDQIIENAVKENQEYVFLTDFNLYGYIEFRKKAISKNLKPIVGLEILDNTNNIILFPTSKKGFKNIIKISSDILSYKKIDMNSFLEDVIVIVKNGPSNYNSKYIFSSNKNNKNYLPINEVFFSNKEDFISYKTLRAIASNKPLDSISDDKENCYLNNIDEPNNENTKKFITLINYDNTQQKTDIIKFPTPNNISSREYLRSLCFEGLKNRIPNHDQKYTDRLEYELSVIDEMGFNDYFLVVNDFVMEANKRNILIGPGRGSAAGSLVSYCLYITLIDPIEYNLIFERFLNPSRKTMPDIDIDVMDVRREEIIEHIFNKYGYEHVAHIITFQRIKSKMALKDVGRVLNIDLKILNRMTKLISMEHDEDLMGAVNNSKELKSFYDNYPELFNIASSIINCPRQTGTHAAGIVISNEELNNIIPTQTGINDATTTQVSMEYLEELGLIKMDILGLSNLTIIYNIIKLIEIMTGNKIKLSDIPLNDKKSFDAASNAKTLGIFQLESPGMRSTLLKIKPQCLEDISIVSALFRPGPQQNIPEFAKRRFSNEKYESIDPRIDDIIRPTNGIIIYQEQVMDIARRVANFTNAEADTLRKIMSKKDSSQLEMVQNKFIEGAISNGYSSKHAIDIFKYIEKFASYGFNHSHSICYALISYYMIFLKEHFTIQFMSVLLSTVTGNHDKINAYCNECIARGIKINKPSILMSNKNFIINKNEIYFGISNIKGIGTETSKKIISIREKYKNDFNDFGKLVYRLTTNGVGEATINLLILSGALDELGKSRQYLLNNLKIAIDSSRNITSDGTYIFEPIWIENSDNSNYEELANKQFELLGYSFDKTKSNSNVNDEFTRKFNLVNLSEISETNKSGNCLVKILNVKEIMTKFGKIMAFIKVQGDIVQNLTCFSYEPIKKSIVIGKCIICEIKFDQKGKRLSKLIEVIDEQK